MNDVEGGINGRPADADALATTTVQGKLIPARRDGVLELETDEDRIELLGAFDTSAMLGDDVEVVGVPAPHVQADSTPGILVRQLRKL